MTDLRKLLQDAADLDDRSIPLGDVLSDADQRLRRRRVVAIVGGLAAAAVVATIVAIAGVPGFHKSNPDPVKDDERDGIYVEERISPAEVESRCNALLASRAGTGKQPFVAGVDHAGRAVAAEDSVRLVETRVGRTVAMVEPGFRVNFNAPPGADWGPGAHQVWCTIPQADMVEVATSREVPRPVDPLDGKAVADRCSRLAGYDLSGWSVLAAAKVHGFLEATFLSDNGYGVKCSVLDDRLTFYGERLRDEGGDPIPPDGGEDARYGDLAPGCDRGFELPELHGSERITCGAVGIIAGLPDDYLIRVGLPTGELTSNTNQGGFAYAFELPDTGVKRRVSISVLSPDDDLVWQRTFKVGRAPDQGVGAIAPP